jgi:hypothetical protein
MSTSSRDSKLDTPLKSIKALSSTVKTPIASDSEDTEENERINMDDINPEDTDLIDAHLRDSLIKAFMVIFTNEKS